MVPTTLEIVGGINEANIPHPAPNGWVICKSNTSFVFVHYRQGPDVSYYYGPSSGMGSFVYDFDAPGLSTRAKACFQAYPEYTSAQWSAGL